jgi:hypothetical protein
MQTVPKETRDQKELFDFYGQVGENQTSITLPFELRLAWDKRKKISRITCHKKCGESFVQIFEDIYNYYDKDIKAIQKDNMDLFGGCLNVRKMRGANRYSLHSWGCAMDLDPDKNQLKWGRDEAQMPEYIIDIFAKYNCENLGRVKNYDFMHFQFCKRSY